MLAAAADQGTLLLLLIVLGIICAIVFIARR